MDPDDIRLLENLWQRVWLEFDRYASRSNMEYAFVRAIQDAASRGRFRSLRGHANWLRAPLPVEVRVEIEDERSAHMSGYLRGDDITVNIRIHCAYFEGVGSYWNMRYHYDRREMDFRQRERGGRDPYQQRPEFPEERLAQIREEGAKFFFKDALPAFDPALSGLNQFVYILRVIADAVALKMAANLSLRPFVTLRVKNGGRNFCWKHGPAPGIVPSVGSPNPLKIEGEVCALCYQTDLERFTSVETLVSLCRLGARVLWDRIDDTSKRFALVKEEREFDPEHPSAWVADPNREFAERLSLIELSDVPEPVKTPPKVFIPVPRAVEVREHSSEIDKWGGVGELLLELN